MSSPGKSAEHVSSLEYQVVAIVVVVIMIIRHARGSGPSHLSSCSSTCVQRASVAPRIKTRHIDNAIGGGDRQKGVEYCWLVDGP